MGYALLEEYVRLLRTPFESRSSSSTAAPGNGPAGAITALGGRAALCAGLALTTLLIGARDLAACPSGPLGALCQHMEHAHQVQQHANQLQQHMEQARHLQQQQAE